FGQRGLADPSLAAFRRPKFERMVNDADRVQYRRAELTDERIRELFAFHHERHGNRFAPCDALVRDLALLALERLRPRIVLVSFLDTDYVHWGIPRFYREGLERIDRFAWEIWQALERDPFYRDDTYLFVVPDCGRSTNPHR